MLTSERPLRVERDADGRQCRPRPAKTAVLTRVPTTRPGLRPMAAGALRRAWCSPAREVLFQAARRAANGRIPEGESLPCRLCAEAYVERVLSAEPGCPFSAGGACHQRVSRAVRERVPHDLSWLELAEGRLRLDRLCRNGVRQLSSPAGPPQTTSRPGTPVPRIPREARKPPSAVLRCAPARERVRRRSPPASRSPSRPRWARTR